MSDDQTPTSSADSVAPPTDPPPASAGRSLHLEVEVAGSPEDVWRAIATGPGISSWYVPHQVEERPGGAALASFGPGPEMQIPGRVAAWEPPHRIVFDGGEGVGGMAFEWTVEARDGGRCIVRLVNSGFGEGVDWDAQYDGMKDGWALFLMNLRLHLEHFAGRSGTAMLPMATWSCSRAEAWQRLADFLGARLDAQQGDRIVLDPGRAPRIAGTVVDTGLRRLALLIDEPAPGTAFVAVEGSDEQAGVSVWASLYGDDAPAIADRARETWQEWLDGSG